MAVGIPGKGKINSGGQYRPALPTLRLEYPGKKPVEAIIETPPGQYYPSATHCEGENRLYHADNMGVLSALAQDTAVSGQVRLVYIDPPFATAWTFTRASKITPTMIILSVPSSLSSCASASC